MPAGAEGACQETDAEHWQRHSSQPGAHLCCLCNFIKRQIEINRDFPWCSPRPQSMGGQWRLGCDMCARMVAAPQFLRDSICCPGRFARDGFVPHGEWGHMHTKLKHHAGTPGHKSATIGVGRLLLRLPQWLLNECAAGAAGGIRPWANVGVSKGSDEAVVELAASVVDEASRWRPCGRSSSEQ